MSAQRIVVDLSKAQYCIFYYKNQYGNKRRTLPKRGTWTLHGVVYDNDEKQLFSAEPLKDVAMRRESLDVWTPEVKVQFSSNHYVIYAGDKAKSIWKEWNRRQFKKGK